MLTRNTVKQLSIANLIILLDQQGGFLDQGSLVELRSRGIDLHPSPIQRSASKTVGPPDTGEALTKTDINGDELHLTASDEPKADTGKDRKTGDWTIYKYYTRALGTCGMAVFILLVAASEACAGMTNVWLNWWAESNDSGTSNQPSLAYWFGLFGFISIMAGALMSGATL